MKHPVKKYYNNVLDIIFKFKVENQTVMDSEKFSFALLQYAKHDRRQNHVNVKVYPCLVARCMTVLLLLLFHR